MEKEIGSIISVSNDKDISDEGKKNIVMAIVGQLADSQTREALERVREKMDNSYIKRGYFAKFDDKESLSFADGYMDCNGYALKIIDQELTKLEGEGE